MSTPQRRGLGRGLELLVGGGDERSELAQIRVDQIEPNSRQPRRRFEPEATSGLAESIKRQGLLQPVVVRPRAEGGYELIAGERRWRAAREAGIEELPADRARGGRPRLAPARARRERGARAAVRGRGGACVRRADGRVRPVAGRSRRARRPLEAVRVEPAAPARVARRGAVDARPRRADRGARARGARGAGERRTHPPRDSHRAQRALRAGCGTRCAGRRGEAQAPPARRSPSILLSRRASRPPRRARRAWPRRSRTAGSRSRSPTRPSWKSSPRRSNASLRASRRSRSRALPRAHPPPRRRRPTACARRAAAPGCRSRSGRSRAARSPRTSPPRG